MKSKEKLATEYAKRFGDFGDASKSQTALDFLAGFEKALDLVSEKFQEQADWAYEGFNMGDATIRDCQYAHMLLSHVSRKVKQIGNREI